MALWPDCWIGWLVGWLLVGRIEVHGSWLMTGKSLNSIAVLQSSRCRKYEVDFVHTKSGASYVRSQLRTYDTQFDFVLTKSSYVFNFLGIYSEDFEQNLSLPIKATMAMRKNDCFSF